MYLRGALNPHEVLIVERGETPSSFMAKFKKVRDIDILVAFFLFLTLFPRLMLQRNQRKKKTPQSVLSTGALQSIHDIVSGPPGVMVPPVDGSNASQWRASYQNMQRNNSQVTQVQAKYTVAGRLPADAHAAVPRRPDFPVANAINKGVSPYAISYDQSHMRRQPQPPLHGHDVAWQSSAHLQASKYAGAIAAARSMGHSARVAADQDAIRGGARLPQQGLSSIPSWVSRPEFAAGAPDVRNGSFSTSYDTLSSFATESPRGASETMPSSDGMDGAAGLLGSHYLGRTSGSFVDPQRRKSLSDAQSTLYPDFAGSLGFDGYASNLQQEKPAQRDGLGSSESMNNYFSSAFFGSN